MATFWGILSMLHHIVLIAAGWTAGQGFAAVSSPEKCVTESSNKKVCYRYVDEERVLDKLTVTPSNGGINPREAAYSIQSSVVVAGNSCQAKGLKAVLREEEIAGESYVVARVRGWQRVDQICIEIYQPVRADLDLTLRGPSAELSKVTIKNVGELGLDVPLQSACLVPLSCPSSGQPSVCFYDGLEFTAETLCQAEADARKNACLKGVVLDRVSCEDSLAPL